MATKTRRKTSKNSSLVPVLFTLGVIGWGFFAIDRLTTSSVPDYEMSPIEAHDIKSVSKNSKNSWKKSAEDFLSNFKKGESGFVKDNQEYDNWHAVSMDEETTEEIPQNKQVSISGYSLYFYSDTNSDIKLTQVKFSDSISVSLSRIFQQLINGPGDKNNFLDSFPIKPSVIDAKRENDTLVLNLDDNFGHGISFETAELQVKQILKTASQFKDIKYLKITINSGDIENISIDGLTIPSRFKLN